MNGADRLSARLALSTILLSPALAADPALAQATLRLWDGSDTSLHRNGVIDGGSGLWSPTEDSWTNSSGTINGPMRPSPVFVEFQGAAGTVTVDDSAAPPAVTGMRFLTDGYRVTGGAILLDGGPYTSIQSAQGTTTRIEAALTGAGGVFFNDFGTVILSGKNSYQGITRNDGGTLIGNVDSIPTEIENGGYVIFDQAQDGSFAHDITGVFSFYGLMGKRGAGSLTLEKGTTLDWRIEEGRVISAAARFGARADIRSGGALMLTTSAGESVDFRGRLTGEGRFEVAGDGVLRLTGSSPAFTGQTVVADSALRIEGTVGGTVQVDAGGRLSGTGTAGAVAVGDGGHLVGQSGDTLRMASLSLKAGSVIEAQFGAAGDPALFAVAGDLTLDGTLHVRNETPLGEGLYRLISYDGALTDRGLALAGADGGLSIQTATPGQVNLLSGSAERPLLFWDGGDPTRHGNGVVDGGPGSWRSGAADWTGADGRKREAARAEAFAIFAGAGGRAVIDGGAGPVATAGLQFAVSGYGLSGAGLTLAGGAETVIRVGDGGAWASTISAEIAAPLSGDTKLVKRDAGTLILSGVNSYNGGTLVEGGTLIGDSRSIRGDVANAATIIFNQRDNDRFDGAIDALGDQSGTVVKRGSGTLSLGGVSRIDWRLEEGRVATSATRFTGNAELRPGAELLFEEAGDGRYAASLSGSGRFLKSGGGSLTLTGDSSGFAGASQIQSGRLIVDGALGGTLSVEGNAILSGRGRIGSVRIAPGGTIAPGAGIATLRVEGDLTLTPGSRYEVEVDPAGTAADRIDVGGVATLGGTVAHIGANGTYRPSSTYTILTAGGGVQGRFDAVTSTYAFLTPRLGYTANAVTLTLDRNDVRFGDVAATANQRATGAALEGLAAGNRVQDAVLMSDAATARQAFDRLSGAFHASLRSALIESSTLSRDATLDRLRAPAADRPGLAIWGEQLDGWSHMRGNGNAARMDRAASGELVGVEVQAPDGGLRLGMIGGHHRDTLRGQGQADIDSYHGGFYGGGAVGGMALRGGLLMSWQDIAVQRSVAFSGFAEGLATRYRAVTAQAFAEAARRFEMAGGAIEPFASLAHVQLRVGRGRESGSAAALNLSGDAMRTSFTTAGLRGDARLALGGVSALLRASAGWQHGFGARLPVIDASLSGQQFNVSGLPIARDAMVSEVALDSAIGRRLRLSLSYRGALSQGNQDHMARAALGWRF